MAMTDLYIVDEETGKEIFCTAGTWQVAYLLVNGYDYADYYKNPENEKELVFQFNDVDDRFKELVENWHKRKGEPGKFNNYREIYRKISKIIKEAYI